MKTMNRAVIAVLVALVAFDAHAVSSPTIRGNVTQLAAVDGGTLPTASTVPGGMVFLVYPTDSGIPVYSDGVSWNPIGSSNSSGWITALDCDFTTHPSTPLDAGDGNYSICGVTFVSVNQANTVNRPDLVNGTGLVIQPTQAPAWYGTTPNTPMFYVQLSSVIPSLTPTMRFRITVLHDASNASESYHGNLTGVYSLMDNASLYGWLGAYQIFNTALRFGGDWNTGQANNTQGPNVNNASIRNQQVIMLDYTGGLAGNAAAFSVDYSDGGVFPPAPNGYPLARVQPPTNTPFYTVAGVSAARVYFTAQRSGAAAVYTGVLKRLLIEYKP